MARKALARLRIADRRHFQLLDHAQQFDLHVRRNVGRFVKENRGAVGQLEQTGAGSVGTGECAFHVTEQLALDQRWTERGQIDRYERAVGTHRVPMNRPRDQLLAGATLTSDQHRAITGGNQGDPFEDVLHGRTGAQQLVGRAGRQFGDLARGPGIANRQRTFNHRGGLLQIERFRQIVERAVLNRRHRGLQIAKGGDHDDRNRTEPGGQFLHRAQSIHAGQTDVDHHQLRPLGVGCLERLLGR